MRYRIAICEDDTECAAKLKEMIKEIMTERRTEYLCERYADAENLTSALTDSPKYQILFLDTVLNGKSGVEFAKKLRQQGVHSPIIFLSSSSAPALSAYAAEPTHFLLKPVMKQDLNTALCRVFRQRESSFVCMVKTSDGEIAALSANDILYLEVYDKVILVHCRGGNTLTAAGPLTDFCGQLPAGRFCACHRCYAVDFAGVRRLRRNEFVLEDGTVIPVARRRFDQVLSAWKTYINEEKMK